MQDVLDAETVLVQIQEQAEKIKNDETQQFPEAASPGDSWRQGDIYITLLDKVPDPSLAESKPKKQLAPGTTQGSRHCLDSLEGVTIYSPTRPGMLEGPVILLREERAIEHPEHGDIVLPPGIYGISYQRSLDSEERERRVLD